MSEYAADRRRGYFASFPDRGSYLGFAARSVLVSILQLRLGASATGEYGWRIPRALGPHPKGCVRPSPRAHSGSM
ncbi:hypothetical protein SAT01_26240 [Sinomonas atrocyanea]|nr:hypothetical protein SAT01_26240 [Sinomonas atrocyanea]GGG58618.1 hypothetical protein GCM10007172_06830 [Sinomonas atrocyanea]